MRRTEMPILQCIVIRYVQTNEYVQVTWTIADHSMLSIHAN
eukprot:XP_001705458.1 Hypothetical protein GL50803_8179 [Giardia lamblia ATCC 50803]